MSGTEIEGTQSKSELAVENTNCYQQDAGSRLAENINCYQMGLIPVPGGIQSVTRISFSLFRKSKLLPENAEGRSEERSTEKPYT